METFLTYKEKSREIEVIKWDGSTGTLKVIQDKIDTGCVEFKMRDDNPRTLPNLDIRWDWDLNNIQKIEILSKTASGLSANIKVKRCFKQYDYDNEDQETTKLVYQEDTFDKVRMSKINHMISWNKEIIV